MRKVPLHVLIILGIVSFLGNIILVTYLILTPQQQTTPAINKLQDASETYPNLSKRIFSFSQNDIIINFIELRNQLRNYHDSIPDKIGTYFEYLPSGVSIGINEKENFVLASLLKVPLVMAVYKAIDDGTLHHDQILTIRKEDINTGFGDLWKRGVGAQITVDEAIGLTLTKSDNTANALLYYAVQAGSLEEIFDQLDIPKDVQSDEQALVTPKNYSSILRSLYLSSILQTKDSNAILDLLTQSTFNDKIKAGIPKHVAVAHKIGTYEYGTGKVPTYTDCGIVYVPKRPYILCIMTKTTEEKARIYMRTISRIVYDYVSKQ